MGYFLIGFILGVVLTSLLFAAVIFAQELARLMRRWCRKLSDIRHEVCMRAQDLRERWSSRSK